VLSVLSEMWQKCNLKIIYIYTHTHAHIHMIHTVIHFESALYGFSNCPTSAPTSSPKPTATELNRVELK